MTKKTKNEQAWERIFRELSVLEEIKKRGLCELQSSVLNKYRQSRLLAKIDSKNSLPYIFKENNLSMLPISRKSYVIGEFVTFHDVEEEQTPLSYVEPLKFETLTPEGLFSESLSILFAYHSNLFSDVIGEDLELTITGRMTTVPFEFIISSTNPQLNKIRVRVENAQMEIDAGFEGTNLFVIVEAKNYFPESFNIRQIYYPFRHWMIKTKKEVKGLFMTYSDRVFTLSLYEFSDPEDFNSLKLVKRNQYKVSDEPISLDDIVSVFERVNIIQEPQGIPFPQADTFSRIVDLINALSKQEMSREEITLKYDFDIRQTKYYTDAAIYLGLLEKSSNGKYFKLSSLGSLIVNKPNKKRYLDLVGLILQHRVFYETFLATMKAGKIIGEDEIVEIMNRNQLDYSPNTLTRRATTVKRWIEWIFNLEDKIRNF